MPVTDAQVHVWEAEPQDDPWPEGGQAAAARHREPLGPDELLGLMDEAGVDRAVLVPPFFQGFRNDYALDAARAHPDRFRVMPRIDLRADTRQTELDALIADPVVTGLRFVLVQPAGMMLRDAALEWLRPIASDRGIPVAFHAPGQLDGVAGLASRFPDLRLTVDHLGLSGAQKDTGVAPEINTLVGLSRFANVNVKATTLPIYSTEAFPYPALHGPLRQVIAAFGPERVFWGSDLSRLPGSYPDLVRLFREEFSFLSGADLDAVMGDSLCAWLGWPASGS